MAAPVTAQITKSTLFSQAHDNLFVLINTRSLVPDPVDSAGARKFVYKREPFVDSNNFAGYPYIVVEDPDASFPTYSADASNAMALRRAVIRVVSRDFRSDNLGHASGQNLLDEISDSIATALHSSQKNLWTYGLGTAKINNSVSREEYSDKGEFVFVREFEVSFKQFQNVN